MPPESFFMLHASLDHGIHEVCQDLLTNLKVGTILLTEANKLIDLGQSILFYT